MSGIEPVWGGGSNLMGMPSDDASLNRLLDLLYSYGVRSIDSAEIYLDSEKDLGRVHAGEKFALSTKNPGGAKPGVLKDVLKTMPLALERMKVKQIDIFYIHWPDTTVNMEEVLLDINELYQMGLFKRFGLSNYTTAQTQSVYDFCNKNNCVLPSAWQGMYNAFSRNADTTLLPTLRKLGISFYAYRQYSPSAGGFFAKTPAQVQEGVTRFAKDAFAGMYRSVFAQPKMLEGLEEGHKIAVEFDCSGLDLSLRWLKYHSPLKPEHGDALVIGARTYDQLVELLAGLGADPLPEGAVKRIDSLWEDVKDVAAYDTFFKDAKLPTTADKIVD